MNKQILDLREELNEIDQKLGKLLVRRFEICKKIGENKKENNLPIEDLEREKEIINEKINQLDIPEDFVEELFLLIFKHSKKIQNGN
jgi:chorismate mutase